MSADIIQFRPRSNPNRDMPVEITNVKLMPGTEAYVDPSGFVILYQVEDTAPCDYVAPPDDSA